MNSLKDDDVRIPGWCRSEETPDGWTASRQHDFKWIGFIPSAAAASLMSSAALAQTVQPNTDSTPTTVTSPTTAVTGTKWITQEAPGQWRPSKLIGLNVYNKA
jgi:hypothetical protein